MNIFVLRTYSLESSFLLDAKNPPPFPLELYESNQGMGIKEYFSSKTKALNHFKKEYDYLDDDQQHRLIYFTLDEEEVDTGNTVNWQLYNPKMELLMDGKTLEKPFKGNDNPKHQAGQWVVFIYNKHLRVGKIFEVPPTVAEVKKIKGQLDGYENCYYIAYHDPTNPKDTQPHAHLEEKLILSLIPNKEIHKYLSSGAIKYIEDREKKG